MRATAKSSKPCTRASVGIFEPPEAGEIEVFGKAQYEADDSLNITVVVIVDPKGTALRRVLTGEIKARDIRVVGILIFVATLLEQRERAGSIAGCADIDQARKMGEVGAKNPEYLGRTGKRAAGMSLAKSKLTAFGVVAPAYPAARPRTSSAHWFRLLPDSSAASAALR